MFMDKIQHLRLPLQQSFDHLLFSSVLGNGKCIEITVHGNLTYTTVAVYWDEVENKMQMEYSLNMYIQAQNKA